MTLSSIPQKKQIPIREGLFTTPLLPTEQVRLVGSKCRLCEEVLLGKYTTCPNCAGDNIEEIAFSRKGKLWSYTTIRHRPPGDYKGPDPFVPFGLGLVELPEGIRVLSPIDCDIGRLEIGMELELVIYTLYQVEEGNEVMAFKFKSV